MGKEKRKLHPKRKVVTCAQLARSPKLSSFSSPTRGANAGIRNSCKSYNF